MMSQKRASAAYNAVISQGSPHLILHTAKYFLAKSDQISIVITFWCQINWKNVIAIPNPFLCVYKTVPVLLSLHPSFIFPFHLLPPRLHPTGFSFYILPGFLAIFILLASLPLLSCCIEQQHSVPGNYVPNINSSRFWNFLLENQDFSTIKLVFILTRNGTWQSTFLLFLSKSVFWRG